MKPSFIQAGSYRLPLGERTLIMGILNTTPDSFSDGGRYDSLDTARRHAEKLVKDGADIVDIGGESTRPGVVPVSLEEELDRVLPIVEALSNEIEIPLSIDTYKAGVADAAIQAGADIINDVWGARKDPAMASIAAKHQAPIILSHNRLNANYMNLVEDVIADLMESVHLVKEQGVVDEKIILDPGIGFAKSYEDNLHLLKQLRLLTDLPHPLLLGTSRKRFIGDTLNLPVEERVEGTAATVAWGVAQGCQMVRVHDVKEMARVCRMTEAILRG